MCNLSWTPQSNLEKDKVLLKITLCIILTVECSQYRWENIAYLADDVVHCVSGLQLFASITVESHCHGNMWQTFLVRIIGSVLCQALNDANKATNTKHGNS